MRVELNRQTLLLLILVVVLLLVVVFYVLPSDGPVSAANGGRPSRPVAAPGGPSGFTPDGLATDVYLEGLTASQPEPLAGERNPFRFEARRVPPPAPGPAAPPAEPPPDLPPPVAGPPPTPAISLKFIGLVEAPEGRGRFAVLSDGRFVYHGREGSIIDGRYRIVRIGLESIELEHVDGRGRQTIRLTG
jgi:hypothetical protein